MPYTPSYQAYIHPRNPYAAQANDPGRDHGLWSVLGRAIRSTVPERGNAAFDKSRPVSDDNLPYQKPGFFRALLGDRGADFNRAARLNQDDLDVNADLTRRDEDLYQRHRTQDEAADTLKDVRRFIQAGLRDWWNNSASMNRARALGLSRENAARISAEGRLRPRQMTPEELAYKQSVTKYNNARADEMIGKKATLDKLTSGAGKPAAPGLGFFDRVSNWWNKVTHPISSRKPAAIPGQVDIDPADLGGSDIDIDEDLNNIDFNTDY